MVTIRNRVPQVRVLVQYLRPLPVSLTSLLLMIIWPGSKTDEELQTMFANYKESFDLALFHPSGPCPASRETNLIREAWVIFRLPEETDDKRQLHVKNTTGLCLQVTWWTYGICKRPWGETWATGDFSQNPSSLLVGLFKKHMIEQVGRMPSPQFNGCRADYQCVCVAISLQLWLNVVAQLPHRSERGRW